MSTTQLDRNTQLAAQQLLASWTGSALTFEVPNLDDVDEPELLAYQMLFGTLATYCEFKRDAVQLRVRGRVEEATRSEKFCESLYRRLPSWAKW